jgi:hypothetical protein
MNWMKKSLSKLKWVCILLLSLDSSARDIVLIEKSDKPKSEREAFLVLPGFGTVLHNTKNQRAHFKNQGYDVYIPDYISRKTLNKCAENVAEFYNKHELSQYKKVHVLAYIIGSWTLNNWLQSENPPRNIETIIYDRSPMQEMVPAILVEENPLLSRLLFGKLIKELSVTPYTAIENDQKRIGMLMECKATNIMRKKRKSLSNYPEVQWSVESRGQAVDDHIYLFIDHDDMYANVQLIAPSVFHFIRNGMFSADVLTEKCQQDPFEERK